MRVRPKRPESILRRRREDRRAHAASNGSARSETAVSAPAASSAREQRARERGPLQDHALYTCGCGYVFEAAVSTTVGCPHCGGEQAW